MKSIPITTAALLSLATTAFAQQGNGQRGGMMGSGEGGDMMGHGWGWGMGGFGYGWILTIIVVLLAVLYVVFMVRRK